MGIESPLRARRLAGDRSLVWLPFDAAGLRVQTWSFGLRTHRGLLFQRPEVSLLAAGDESFRDRFQLLPAGANLLRLLLGVELFNNAVASLPFAELLGGRRLPRTLTLGQGPRLLGSSAHGPILTHR